MQISQIIVTVLITTVIIAAIIFTTAASIFPRTAEAHAFGSWQGHGFGPSGKQGSRHGMARRNPCASLELPLGKLASVLIEDHLKLNADQSQRLQPIMGTIETWRQEAKTQCDGFDHTNVNASLNTMETFLRSSADRLAELQPAWTDFYASLNDQQKAHISRALQHSHGDTEQQG